MDQTINEQVVQTDEEAKASDAGNYAFKDVTYLVEHEVTLQPVSDIARCFVGTTFRHRTVLTQLQHLFHRIMVAAGFSGVALMPLLFRQQIFNGAVQRQVRITTNRRSKVRIGLQCQAKVTTVFWIVNRLFHRAQQHGLQHFCIRTIGNRLQQLRVVTRFRLVTARQFQPQLRQH